MEQVKETINKYRDILPRFIDYNSDNVLKGILERYEIRQKDVFHIVDIPLKYHEHYLDHYTLGKVDISELTKHENLLEDDIRKMFTYHDMLPSYADTVNFAITSISNRDKVIDNQTKVIINLRKIEKNIIKLNILMVTLNVLLQ